MQVIKRIRTIQAARSCGVAAAALVATGFPSFLSPAHAADSGFQPFKDTQAGFALAKPGGWHVSTEQLAIWVESPDKSELVLTRAFHAEPGETAQQWLEKLGDKYGARFPNAKLDQIQHQNTRGDEIVAALHYDGPNGPAQLRALCSIVNGKGLLYVIAAPTPRFEAERPKLLHVAKSLVFTVPKSAGTSRGDSGGVTAAQVAATARSISWTSWTEPREHAFHVSIPKGWTPQGGVFRHGDTDVRIAYGILSPKKDISIVIGDPRLSGFSAPNALSNQVGMGDGHGTLHYMRVPEFNQTYLREMVSQDFRDIRVGQSQELPQLSKQLAAQMNQMAQGMAHCEASVGITEFTGVDRTSGKSVSGAVFCMTSSMSSTAIDSTTWTANPMLIVAQTGDSQDAARQRTAMAVWMHLQQTYREDPEWTARRTRELGEVSKAQIAAAGERSQEIAKNSAAAEDAIMGRFHSHEQAVDAQQNAFINYIGDKTDVTDGAGHAAKVDSGYSHYYRNDRTGAIMGTNSAYSPGVDFSPMSQF